MSNLELQEVLEALRQRDEKDAVIDQQNHDDLVRLGLELMAPARSAVIDSGAIIGIDNVADKIIVELLPTDHIIAVEGESGSGKSATVRSLVAKLDGIRYSLSEIFRYLTYRWLHNREAVEDIIPRLSYILVEDKLCLFDGDLNVTLDVYKKMQTSEIDESVPKIAKDCQAEVIRLAARELKELSHQTAKPIIIEGRGFTLDFLPANIRIKLIADLQIRAERRLRQRLKAVQAN